MVLDHRIIRQYLDNDMVKESELRFASLISGSGTTMETLVKACQENGELNGIATPALIVASKPDAPGLLKAKNLDRSIPTKVLNRKDYPKGDEGVKQYGKALVDTLNNYNPDAVLLNGFMVKVSEEVINDFESRIFNQHPGPVPEFGGQGMYGRRVHAAVLYYMREIHHPDPFTEMVAQRVEPEYDQGAVVKSQEVQILSIDTVDSLQQRSLPTEHKVQITLLMDMANGDLAEQRNSRLFVSSDKEKKVLEDSKRIAKRLYPNG